MMLLLLGIADAAPASGKVAEATLRAEQVRKVRVFAIGWHMHVGAGVSQESYAAEMDRLVGLVQPHLAEDQPNLLVFPERVDLPAPLIGSRGDAARAQTTLAGAIEALAQAYQPAIADAMSRFGVTDPNRGLLLATTDTVWRAFSETFRDLARREHVFIVANGGFADAMKTSDPQLVALYGDPDHPERATAFVPADGKPYNQTVLFGPDGQILGRARKVNLVPLEIQAGFAPGSLDDVRVFDLPVGKLGVAISLDAFTDAYLRRLADLGAEIVVQNDANSQLWAAPAASGQWQPREWLGSVLGSIAPTYAPIRYNICPMLVGNFFDLPFDGQTSITASAPMVPEATFVGVDEQPYTGRFLFTGPWAFPDPGQADPSLTREQRQVIMNQLALSLLPGGANEDQYRETIGWSDLDLEE
jgi:predicted amidohydrolase